MKQKVEKQVFVIRQIITKIIGEGDLSQYDQLVSKTIKSHCPESWKAIHSIEIDSYCHAQQIDANYSRAFRPINIDVEEICQIDSHRFFTRWKCEKLHANPFFGIKASYRKIKLSGQTIYRLNDEMVLEESWHSWDMLGLLQQIDWHLLPPISAPTINREKFFLQAKNLTNREKECLHLQVNGKTARETAALLFISPRTVESHFDNLKNKLDCKNKKELFAIAKMLENYQLLV